MLNFEESIGDRSDLATPAFYTLPQISLGTNRGQPCAKSVLLQPVAVFALTDTTSTATASYHILVTAAFPPLLYESPKPVETFGPFCPPPHTSVNRTACDTLPAYVCIALQSSH